MTIDLAGFGIRNFRSFRNSLQLVSPMKKMTFVAGRNNSGKSNLLVAVSKCLPGGDAEVPTGFDVPELSDEPERFEFAVEVDESSEIFEALAERGNKLAESTYCRVWRKARVQALTVAEALSPLAGRPYDLRHAAVSTWLNAGVPSTQVAEWAGHSLAVLLQIYAKCLVGQEETARRRIDAVLGGGPDA